MDEKQCVSVCNQMYCFTINIEKNLIVVKQNNDSSLHLLSEALRIEKAYEDGFIGLIPLLLKKHYVCLAVLVMISCIKFFKKPENMQ